ncbi:tRNA preQ1(34) S-adenosylmethionine ribosyltransferase-isomerase QueA [Aestuariivirga sp.]|jgi:S-adenosylmethionine:tRNA ribosyltransferase-isomerase|uniref:tRNA preQ1(34) S-adenosylmethionine ribosyltransferase-isomerase QueA n=1 Tax=Aestuariivirga sp. TaxID=2650926 RepID=UPI0037843E6D
MRLSDFDFDLPSDRIALRPASPRDAAKLLVVRPDRLEDRVFRELPDLLRPGDVLVFNNTRVIPAALRGYRAGRGGTTPKIEVLLHQRMDGQRWKAFAKPAKKLQLGDNVIFVRENKSLAGVIVEKGEAGEVTLSFSLSGPALDGVLAEVGEVPLPPYIAGKRATDAEDKADYQTVYAEKEGAVAAPTAGLHFTSNLIRLLEEYGISTEFVTLHVGAGTFLPVKVDEIRQHRMHAEWGEVSLETCERLKAARGRGGRIVAVGTTSLRLLESSGLAPFSGTTEIFITPGYRFRAVDLLITNFHLPKSTLFMLVAAFSGLGRMREAYAHAITHDYRFYSYGDSSLLFPAP